MTEQYFSLEWIWDVYISLNQPWILTGRTDAEALVLWPPDAKNWLVGKYPDAGKDWRQKEKSVIERGWDGWMASPVQ